MGGGIRGGGGGVVLGGGGIEGGRGRLYYGVPVGWSIIIIMIMEGYLNTYFLKAFKCSLDLLA